MSGSETIGHTIERAVTPDGHELALVQRGEAFEIIYNGTFLMASDCRRSEQSLAELAIAPLGRDDVTILVAGLGMGHTLRAALDCPGVVRADVVEISETVVDWNRRHFGALNGNALDDPRVHLHVGDLMGFARRVQHDPLPGVEGGWLAVVLDVDNGPAWLTRPQNEPIYTDEGLQRVAGLLRHGGVLAVWSSARDVEFLRRMHARFVNVAEMAIPVDVNGQSSLDYVYRGRRPPEARSGAGGGGRVAQA